MSSLNHILTGSAVCALAAAAASPATAQIAFDRDHNKSVHERAVEEHMPLGIHTGGFLMLPRLDLGVEFNDNIYAASSAETDDMIFTVAPSVEFDSQWSVHRLNLYGGLASHTRLPWEVFAELLRLGLRPLAQGRHPARCLLARLAAGRAGWHAVQPHQHAAGQSRHAQGQNPSWPRGLRQAHHRRSARTGPA